MKTALLVPNSAIKTIVQEIKQVVNDFFSENGGMQNGYETWVNGTVSRNTFYSIGWSTPIVDKITGIERRSMGTELYNKLHAILEEHDVPREFALNLEKNHTGHGCYNTYITYTYKEQVL